MHMATHYNYHILHVKYPAVRRIIPDFPTFDAHRQRFILDNRSKCIALVVYFRLRLLSRCIAIGCHSLQARMALLQI